ncbi:MAG: hypothetical protein H0U44_04620 [Flavisolibacter sp.]|jgi:hypothetical protein|nr:hypothetical protein [Flavisolibacter sp.]
MVFGNWEISEKNIAFKGDGYNKFEIPLQELNRVVVDRNGDIFYDWILLATEEDWLTQDDLYDLNFAFVYAIGKYTMDFNYNVFDATLAEQFEKFDEEEDDEDNF